MITELKTKLYYLGEEERQRLAAFLKDELGIENVMYIYGNGKDIRLVTYAGAV